MSLPQEMNAAVITEPRKIEIRKIPMPQPGPGEVLLRLHGCGVCGSNLPVWQGREWFEYPQEPGAPGHEGWGEVVAVGDEVTDIEPGTLAGAISFKAYAEYDVAPRENLVKLPAELSGEPFPAEPLGCAVNIFHRANIKKGQWVAIIGIGFLGGLLTGMAARAGARVIAITRRRSALDQAKELGAEKLIAMEDHWEIIDEVKKITGENMCDVVIEAVGEQWPLDLAGELTRERGRLCIAGYHQSGPRQINMQMWNWRGLDVINTHERDPAVYRKGMEEAVDLALKEKLIYRPLITHTEPLSKLNELFQLMEDRPDGFMKALVTMNG